MPPEGGGNGPTSITVRAALEVVVHEAVRSVAIALTPVHAP